MGGYREAAPLELELDWRDRGAADEGLRAALARLQERGIALRATAALELRPYAQALADAEGEVAVEVARELAAQIDRRLAEAGSEERLHRTAPTRWVLASDAAAERLRSEGRLWVEGGGAARVAIRVASALAALCVVVYALASSGAIAVLVGWLALGLGGSLALRVATREGSRVQAVGALVHQTAMVVVPPAELLRRGELGAAGLVVLATLVAWGVQRWNHVRE